MSVQTFSAILYVFKWPYLNLGLLSWMNRLKNWAGRHAWLQICTNYSYEITQLFVFFFFFPKKNFGAQSLFLNNAIEFRILFLIFRSKDKIWYRGKHKIQSRQMEVSIPLISFVIKASDLHSDPQFSHLQNGSTGPNGPTACIYFQSLNLWR